MRLWVEGRGHEERYYFTGNCAEIVGFVVEYMPNYFEAYFMLISLTS